MIQYKLMYFGFCGRGECIRYILAYIKTPYDEVTVTGEEWEKGMKQKMPMKILPVLELANGCQLSQSIAITRYLATKHGDQLVGACEDIYPVYYSGYMRACLSGDESKKAPALKELKEKGIEPLFSMLEKFLGDKKYFCGEKVHWSDVVIAELVNRVETCIDKHLAYKFHKLMVHSKRIQRMSKFGEICCKS